MNYKKLLNIIKESRKGIFEIADFLYSTTSDYETYYSPKELETNEIYQELLSYIRYIDEVLENIDSLVIYTKKGVINNAKFI